MCLSNRVSIYFTPKYATGSLDYIYTKRCKKIIQKDSFMTLGILGKLCISLSFITGLLSLIGYFRYSYKPHSKWFKAVNLMFSLKGILLFAASGILLYLMLNHQFNYYYVYNYTSSNLELKYLISAFWGGQEGSFLLWLLFGELIGLGLMKWVKEPYRGPVLVFTTLNQIFLISMILGWHFGDVSLGASPFRTIAEAFPNAPFLATNPDFVPPDGKGLNDLLKSPWMMIHPPLLFLGFSMMAVPYCFAMAALWKGKVDEWIQQAMPWTLGANLSLFVAIFLGGYWAYVTLSFGGYWAWDPVENASIIPWFIGTAGIHFMLIQRKKGSSKIASLSFAILAFVAVLYESFLTRSGVLGDASVHSFTDLGLYNQLLAFMVVILIIGIGLMIWRRDLLLSQVKETPILSREFLISSGAVVLFLIGLVITIGTSAPILGRLFVENPTPPEIVFYNKWSMPLAIIAALLTVIAQYVYWRKHNLDSLTSELVMPVILAVASTVVVMVLGHLSSFYYTIYLFAAFFALFGNGVILIRLLQSNMMVIGGVVSHIGFALLLVGILASSAYQNNLLDLKTLKYNEDVLAGKITDQQGIPVREPIQFLQLRLDVPTVVNDKYRITYLGHEFSDQARQGQHAYQIKVETLSNGEAEKSFTLYPEVYPMGSGSTSINWSVDVDVHGGFTRDIYMYVAGSAYVENKNREFANRQTNPHIQASGLQKDDWVLLVATEKPFVSLVWLGTFLLMGGFSISIIRHWGKLQKNKALIENTANDQ